MTTEQQRLDEATKGGKTAYFKTQGVPRGREMTEPISHRNLFATIRPEQLLKGGRLAYFDSIPRARGGDDQ